MSAHRPLPNRRPIFVALGVVGCSTCVVLALGTTSPDSTVIFDTGKQATDAAAAPRVSPAPSLIALPGPISTVGPATAATVPASTFAASSAAYSRAYRSSFAAQAVAIVAAPTPAGSKGSSQHSSGGSSPSHVTSHPTTKPDPTPRPTKKPKPHPTKSHPTGSTGWTDGGSNKSGQLPWWWWLVPHGPGTPTIGTGPTVPTVPTIPRLPVPIHTSDSGFGAHGGYGNHDSGHRHFGRR